MSTSTRDDPSGDDRTRDGARSGTPLPRAGSAHSAPSGSDGADDDFRPEDFRSAGVPISADFVARTSALVTADLARIRREAAAVDAVQLPREILDAYAPPAARGDFAARVLDRLQSARGAAEPPRAATGRGRPALSEDALLARYEVPSVSPDFVQRTLDALRLAHSDARHAVPPAPGPLPVRRIGPVLRWAAVAAALVLTLVFLVTRGGASGGAGNSPGVGPFAVAPTASRFASLQDASPTWISTALARLDDRGDGGLRLEPIDPLLMLVADGDRDR